MSNIYLLSILLISLSCVQENFSSKISIHRELILSKEVIDNPINNSSDQNTLNVSGTCDLAGKKVYVRINNSDLNSIEPLVCDGKEFNGSVDISSLSDGIHEIYTYIVNNGIEHRSVISSIVKDVIVPITQTQTVPPILPINNTSYSLTGQCSESGIVNVDIGIYRKSVECILGTFSIEGWDLSSLADNTAIPVSIQMIDLAKNISSAESFSIVKSLSKNFSLFKCHHRKSKVA